MARTAEYGLGWRILDERSGVEDGDVRGEARHHREMMGDEDDGEAVLAPGAHQHVVGRRRDAAPPDPRGPGLAVGRVAARRRVVEQAPRVPAGGE